jgi:Zn-dependent alcohol dehydrogenase
MDAHASGQFPMHELIRYYDIKDYERAIEDMRTGKAIKVVLKWSGW